MAKRKLSKEAYEFIMETIREQGSMSTDEVVELVRVHYDFDVRAAHERELRRYVGQLMRAQRSEDGTRTLFLEKKSSTIVEIEHCSDVGKISAVNDQLRTQAFGLLKSCKKAAKRVRELNGQTSLFDEHEFIQDLMRTSEQRA